MAEKRMLTRKVTDNDNFTALPATAQALYMHLTLNADDDGFCNQISTAMFRAHAKQKDLQALIDARYLLRFESGVIVIKHWRMANALRKDRYETTAYQEEYQRLTLKQNGSYTLRTEQQPAGNQETPEEKEPGNQMATKWQPDDNHRLPQSRVEKNRVEKSNNTETPAGDFERFWKAYPKKVGKEAARRAFEKVKQPVELLINAIEKQLQGEQWQKEDGRYIPNPATWLNQGRWEDEVKPAKTAQRMNPSGTEAFKNAVADLLAADR